VADDKPLCRLIINRMLLCVDVDPIVNIIFLCVKMPYVKVPYAYYFEFLMIK